jgi:hypothetical protein
MQLEISTAISSLSAAMGLARGAVEARDDAKVKEAIIDMSNRLFSIHEAASKLAAENQELQAEIRKLKQEQIDRERYVLRGIEAGRIALLYQPSADDPTPPHYICQACFSSGKKVVLRAEESVCTGASLCCPSDAKHDIGLSAPAALP